MPHEGDLVIIEEHANGQVVRFLSDSLLDPIEVERIGQQLGKALEAGSSPNLVITLDTVTQLSSLMVAVLINLRKDATSRGGEVCLAAVPERVDYLLKLARLEDAFRTFETPEQALEALE